MVILTAERWGFRANDKTYAERMRCLRAASRLVAYDNGYQKEFSTNSILRWEGKFKNEIENGVSSKCVGECNRKGSVSAVNIIKQQHPGYLHHLFRQAIKMVGLNAGFAELAQQMHLSSTSSIDPRPPVIISRRQLNKWFRNNKGKEITPTEKPLDTTMHQSQRYEWVVRNYGLLTNPLVPVA